MADDVLEDWDADFLSGVFDLEEKAISSFTQTQSHFQQPPPPPPPPQPQPVTASVLPVTHSPPRVLSQRITVSSHSFNQPNHIHNSHSHSILPNHEPKQLETDLLKDELGRVSKKLKELEEECSKLRKERDGKEEKLRSVSRIESKEAGGEYTAEIELEDGLQIREQSINHHRYGNTKSSSDYDGIQINAGTFTRKEVGVQTEKPAEYNDLMIKKTSSSTSQCSRKLVDIWDPTSGPNSRRNLVPKLLVACETDVQVLFGCLSSNPSSNLKSNHPTSEIPSGVHLNDQIQHVHSAEAAKVSHLYSMLTKIGYDMVKLKDLIEALVDLCDLENEIIVHKSLCVLRVLLNHVFSTEKKSNRRDNVMVEMSNSLDANESRCYEPGSHSYGNVPETSHQCHIPYETRFKDSTNNCEEKITNDSVSGAECFSLFERMLPIAIDNKEEHIRVEALSIMNLIIMRTNADVEREKFGQLLEFQSVSQLLRKEAGIAVQKQAVHLLYLMLNCPTLLANFCSGYKEEVTIAEDTLGDLRAAPAVKGFCAVLDGLGDCLACHGNSAHLILELKLQRNAIILLAFIASSGKYGFEILLGHRLPRGISLFTLILQILASEDSKASESTRHDDISKERTFLIREALIFLNRLVSNPQYSISVLRVLTNTRDSASLAIDIANRFSKKGKWFWQSDTTTASQTRESEVVDLARVFKKRVFTFLGDIIT